MENQSPPQIQTTQPASPTDPQYPPTTSMPTPAHPHGRFLPKWIAIFLLLLILSLFGLLFIKDFMWQQPIQQPEKIVISPTHIISPTPAPNPKTDWKTYTNTKYNFSFQYPPNVTPRKDSTPEFMGFLEEPDKNQSQKLIVSAGTNPQNLDLEEFIQRNKPIPDHSANASKSFEKKTINENEVLIVRSEQPCAGSCKNTPFEKNFGIYVKGKHVVVLFGVDNRTSISDTKPDEEWINQILSTFKFTQPTTNITQADACADIKNSRFSSVNQQTGGMTPEGASKAHWSIRFTDTTFSWIHTDIVQSGFFTCTDNNITLKDSSVTGTYDPATQILTWDGVAYKKVASEN